MSGAARVRIAHGVAIHGGVGTLTPERMTPELKAAYEADLAASLQAGRSALDQEGDAVDAVVAAVCVLEDSPHFNAGRGSNYDERGVITMDASIMRGADGDAGAVAGVTGVRNPVVLARRVMERSEHLMLIGEGAEAFARTQGLEPVDPGWFGTERRRAELLRALERRGGRPNVLGDAEPTSDPTSKAGTVGAVALDRSGTLAAATSTGGMAGKTWGRVGDTPIIGAGTWASLRCAVSCTGWGEYFIRLALAHAVEARMALTGASLSEAVRAVIWDELARQVPRSGGLVALDADGHVELCFNTPGMYRGWVGEDGVPHVDIWGEGTS